jgi:hypothetical protein
MSTTLTTPQKVVDYVHCTNAALEKAAADRQTKLAQDQKVKALIPDCVEALISNGRVAPENREKLAAALTDPAKCVELLTKLAAHRVEAETQLGRPTTTQQPTKTASARNTYDGQRTDVMRESDRKLFSALGLAVPNS